MNKEILIWLEDIGSGKGHTLNEFEIEVISQIKRVVE